MQVAVAYLRLLATLWLPSDLRYPLATLSPASRRTLAGFEPASLVVARGRQRVNQFSYRVLLDALWIYRQRERFWCAASICTQAAFVTLQAL